MTVSQAARNESFMLTDRITRQIEILGAFRQHGAMTARECLEKLKKHDMNEVKPRITELCEKNLLTRLPERKYDPLTARRVTVYEINERAKQC